MKAKLSLSVGRYTLSIEVTFFKKTDAHSFTYYALMHIEPMFYIDKDV